MFGKVLNTKQQNHIRQTQAIWQLYGKLYKCTGKISETTLTTESNEGNQITYLQN